MTNKPTPKNSESAKELEKAQEQFDKFDNQVKEMTLDRINSSQKEIIPPQTQIAQIDKDKMKEIYLKPAMYIS